MQICLRHKREFIQICYITVLHKKVMFSSLHALKETCGSNCSSCTSKTEMIEQRALGSSLNDLNDKLLIGVQH